jgi:hypothetical protein
VWGYDSKPYKIFIDGKAQVDGPYNAQAKANYNSFNTFNAINNGKNAPTYPPCGNGLPCASSGLGCDPNSAGS